MTTRTCTLKSPARVIQKSCQSYHYARSLILVRMHRYRYWRRVVTGGTGQVYAGTGLHYRSAGTPGGGLGLRCMCAVHDIVYAHYCTMTLCHGIVNVTGIYLSGDQFRDKLELPPRSWDVFLLRRCSCSLDSISCSLVLGFRVGLRIGLRIGEGALTGLELTLALFEL